MIVTPPNSVGGYAGESQRIIGGITVNEMWDALTASHDVADSFGALLGLGTIKNIQRGTISLTTGVDNTKTATITSVDVTKAFCVFLGSTIDNASATHRSSRPRVVLTNATTVTASRGNSTGNMVVSFVVVELN